MVLAIPLCYELADFVMTVDQSRHLTNETSYTVKRTGPGWEIRKAILVTERKGFGLAAR